MKYGNNKITTEYGVFDSKKEYGRFLTLQEMQQRGEISELRRQVKYVLIPAQKLCNGKTFRSITYVADFVYIRDGEEVIEDVKPTFRTPKSEKTYKATAAYKVFTLKRKLMYYVLHKEITEI